MKKALLSDRKPETSKKALITGIAGFAGSHLAEALLEKNISVFGFYHPRHSIDNLQEIKDKITLVACDLLDEKKVKKEIEHLSPDYVFHLAAFSSPAQSFKNPQETLKNNIVGQINLLEALVSAKSKAKILIIGSADEYGYVDPKQLPVKEDAPLLPTSPYAVSKVAQDLLGLQYFINQKLSIVRVRPFNHIGPRQAPVFVIASFASQIAQCEAKGGGTIKVGNLNASRDFTDARDMVKAYILALDKGELGDVYNLGSGHAVKISEVLKLMLKMAKVKIQIKVDKTRLHSHDIKVIYCDFSKFKSKTGWTPNIPLKTTLSDTIDYERQKLKWPKSAL